MADLFRTRDHVADFDAYVTQYGERSAATRARLKARLDVAYGQGKDERLDLFFPSEVEGPAPVHLFIHGGYWRMFGKSDFSFVADTITAAGAIAAVMDYSLMPDVRMATIVGQVNLAMEWLAANAGGFGGDSARLSVSGHSAGAHLCALLLQDNIALQPVGSLLLSGIYELDPLRQSFLQPQIELTEDEVEQFSPLRQSIRSKGTVQILVGEQETKPFHSQAHALADLSGGTLATVPDGNHMSVALDLGTPDSAVGKALTEICSLLAPSAGQ